MNTVCTHCQAINRIPDDRIEDAAKCGRCGHDLFDGEVINATGETFDKLLKDDLPVVIDFWAPWCGPCRNFAPIFEDVAQERSGKVRFVKVNTEAERELSSRFGIRRARAFRLSMPHTALRPPRDGGQRKTGVFSTLSYDRKRCSPVTRRAYCARNTSFSCPRKSRSSLPTLSFAREIMSLFDNYPSTSKKSLLFADVRHRANEAQ